MKREIPKPSIVALFEHYGSNVHSGFGWVKATCVLHEDRNPSASVNDETCRWHCFSCGESGDAIDLIMKVENAGFAAALQTATELAAGSSGGLQPADHQSGGLLPHRSGSRPGRRQWVPSWRGM